MPRPKPAALPHGTYNGYKNYGCRCWDCRRAGREYQQRFKEGPTPGHVHGTENGYKTYGCRCQDCTEAATYVGLLDDQARLQRPVPDRVHGSLNGYNHYGCRCAECREALSSWRYHHRHETGRR